MKIINAKILEQAVIDGPYGFLITITIFTNDKKTYLISNGFGGMDSINGGCTRYIHGHLIELSNNQKIDKFIDGNKNYTEYYNNILNGYDDNQPYLNISGYQIDKIATDLKI